MAFYSNRQRRFVMRKYNPHGSGSGNLRSISTQEYIHGDFDNDGTPNIDDKKPFDPDSKEQVNKEIGLDNTFKYVEEKRAAGEKVIEKLKDKHEITSGRVKDEYSLINKLVKRQPFVSGDLVGVRKDTPNREKARHAWEEFNKKEKVPKKEKIVHKETIGSENKYQTLKNKKNPYRAYHSNTIIDGLGVEAQFRSEKHGALNDEMHLAYKNKEDMQSYKDKHKKLLEEGH
jgi:hypothetical protein